MDLEVMADHHLKPTHPFPSDGIVLGYTHDVVLWEIVELLRLKLSAVLSIPETAVVCDLSYDGKTGKVIPEIQVSGDAAEGLTPDEIKEVIQSVWWGVPPVRPGIRDELQERLQDLRSRRAKEEKEEAS